MQLSFCDKCSRPLSEGSVARGEAVDRDGDLVCAQCVAREQASVKAAAVPAPGVPKPLVEYAHAVWNCDGCGIPVTALDLIEGRASRHPSGLMCVRCMPLGAQPAARVEAKHQPVIVPPQPAQEPRPEARLPSARKLPVSVRKPQPARPAAEEFVREAKGEEKRPILPILLFAIVMPMFAISLYFAVTSQQKLNEVMAGRGNEEKPDRRNERPRDVLTPENPPANTPAQPDKPPPVETAPPVKPDQPPQPPAPTMSTEVARELAAIEQQLAEPVILQLQSKSLADVWEGLIAAGSRRLIATRPFVRALLREPDDNTRALACRVCGVLADREALVALDNMIENDPSEAVKLEARKAKGRLTGSATREVKDMTDSELEEYLRALQRELERRKGKHD
jgi:hypothetical protein